MAATSGLEVNAGEEGDKDRQSLPMSNPLETLQEEIIQKIEQAALKSEAQEPEDQQAQEEQEDMRANDPACLFCDDGGNIMSCDGNCMRSYHIGMVDIESYSLECCNPMDMPEDLGRALNGSNDPFLCPNCLSLCHTCFKCGREGSSDPKLPVNASSVRRCSIFECGRFYHPRCIGKDANDENFICPLHVCAAASKGRCENLEPSEPLIECRRCPVAYHEECIPLALLATRSKPNGKRVWLAKSEHRRGNALTDEADSEGDMVERSLIYCMNHHIEPGYDQPEHEDALFSPHLLSSWAFHYAKAFPHLSSSKHVLAERTEQNKRREATLKEESSARCLASSPPTSASKTGSSFTKSTAEFLWENGKPSTAPVKRRRLVKATEEDPNPQVQMKSIVQLWDAKQNSIICFCQVLDSVKPGKQKASPASIYTWQNQVINVDVGAEGAAGSADDSEADYASDGSLYDFEKDSYWTKEAMSARYASLTSRVSKKITLETIKNSTRMPEPYAMPFKKTITQERLQGILQAFKLARERPRDKHLYVTPKLLNEIQQQEDNMRTSLAFYLHNDRYSSYGRHFTKTEHLHIVAKKLEVFINPGDTVVDFSCGHNAFLPILKRQCLQYGKAITGRAFDIITACISEDFQQISWFDVEESHIGARGENLVIGLNPPYGMNNALSVKFQEHAARFRPRIIVLIVPPSTPIPRGYVVVLDDRTTMADKAFYIPGLPEDKKDQWNKTTPAFRILARGEDYPLTDRLHLRHMGPVARDFKYTSFPAPAYHGPPLPMASIMPMGPMQVPSYRYDAPQHWNQY